MTVRRSITATASIIALLLSACGQVEGAFSGPDGEVKAVATTGMIGDAVSNVGGDLVDVQTLMGPGVDPHLYKASAGDVGRINEADIVFYNGLHLEAAMAEVLEETETVTTVAVADVIDDDLLLRPPEFEGQFDPHVWFDVSLWATAVRSVGDALRRLDPSHVHVYDANEAAYLDELAELDVYVRERAALVPEERRVLITAHDAFNYFGEAYGVDVRGLIGISTASEAGTRDIRDLAEFIAERQIPAIFVESSVPARAIEAVQAAVRANGAEVGIGGELFSDAMGDKGTEEGTYVGMVRHNVDVIADALGAGEDGR
ncbi:MAG: zinc ABC transporter substrate-binding protein [Actinobacteria bacterium]|nr:zinc ABC transporter substrate-binding protein [Actinomycetota bacterium]